MTVRLNEIEFKTRKLTSCKYELTAGSRGFLVRRIIRIRRWSDPGPELVVEIIGLRDAL